MRDFKLSLSGQTLVESLRRDYMLSLLGQTSVESFMQEFKLMLSNETLSLLSKEFSWF